MPHTFIFVLYILTKNIDFVALTVGVTAVNILHFRIFLLHFHTANTGTNVVDFCVLTEKTGNGRTARDPIMFS